MDEYIRQLTHDNELFDESWSKIFDELHKLSANISDTDQLSLKVNTLNALVDYILADHEPYITLKLTFLELIIRPTLDEPLPSLDELIRIFCRVLEVDDINNEFNVMFLQKYYYLFSLGQRLSKLPSVNLIEPIFKCLQKHQFRDETLENEMKNTWKNLLSRTFFSPLSCDINKFNSIQTLNHTRSQFQHFYRYTVGYCQHSTIWKEVHDVLIRNDLGLFDSFSDPNELLIHLAACAEQPTCRDYVDAIAKYYQNHVDLFKIHANQVFTTMEKLIIQDNLQAAGHFMEQIIIKHFNTITDYEELIQMFIRLCPLVQSTSSDYFCRYFIAPLTYELSNKKYPKKLALLFFDLLLGILDLCIIRAPNCTYRMLYISDFYPWKQLEKQITHLIQSCITYDTITICSTNELEDLKQILKLIVERVKMNQTIFQATHQVALQAICKWSSIIDNRTSQPYLKHVFTMGEVMTNLVEEKKISSDICNQLLEPIQIRIENNDESKDISAADDSFLISIAHLIIRCMKQMSNRPIALHEKIASICLTAFSCPFNREDGSLTFPHLLTLALWHTLIYNLQSEEEATTYEKCADRLHELIYKENEEKFYSWWSTFWCVFATKYPNIAIRHIQEFLDELIDHKKFDFTSIISILYTKQPDAFLERLDDIIHILFEDNGRYFHSLISLFGEFTRTNPEWITAKHIDYIFTSMKTYPDPFNQLNYMFTYLEPVTTIHPQLFDKYRDEFLRLITEKQSISAFLCFKQYLLATAILHGEQTADEHLTLLIHLVQSISNMSSDLSQQIFHTCQLIGLRYKTILANKRNDLLPFKSNPVCQTLIDLIDGNKISEENQAAINRTIDEMAQIEQRVAHTEQGVENLTKIVKRQELNIVNLDQRVDNVDTRINEVVGQIENQAREIERLDAKTLSYVPSEWGRQVCTLLNVRANNDWRLLGKRFGYSSSELKHWAMQLDPSMSLLNEWFMTHKADEATYGLIKTLKDIGRNDIEEIIRKAVTAAGDLIPDDLPIDIKRCPPVFLSYQWGSQQAVLKLKDNLEQAGYACWMDIGQMGGGDKLFEKIDAGIRGAKVVICCMNKPYAQSDNCSREVHLTISTGKPLIPLQMEKQTWPPEGALGPIMSEYLFIRFYDRKSSNPDFWPEDKFMEILGQIRYHVAPDPDMITAKYQNWFVPRIDKLIFLQPSSNANENTGQPTITDDTPLIVIHPQIMISYQWDYQNDIVKLYEKLTKLGYCCWLDIFQMGGGDSLFEKIDTGIRHAKCILACVTPKYTKSINCRREMALSDALKKPIVPLYLEDTSSWPPSGPMSMVFAEKTYIDFRRSDNVRGRWIGKEYKLLLARLKQEIPEVEPENPQRRLLDMQRPTTAMKDQERKMNRIGSAPVTPSSQACSIM